MRSECLCQLEAVSPFREDQKKNTSSMTKYSDQIDKAEHGERRQNWICHVPANPALPVMR